MACCLTVAGFFIAGVAPVLPLPCLGKHKISDGS